MNTFNTLTNVNARRSPIWRTIAVVAIAGISLQAAGYGWLYVCEQYSETTAYGCSVVEGSCIGSCATVGPISGSTSCGQCVDSWNPLDYCSPNPSPPTTILGKYAADCEWQQVYANPPYQVVWECTCGQFAQTGTGTFICYCQ